MLKDKSYIKAFSLIELLVVIAMVATILLITLPSLQGMVSKNHSTIYANMLMTTLQFTRSAAIKLSAPVVFCGSEDHESCNDSWQKGSIVVTTITSKVMRVLPPVFAGDRLTWHGSSGIKKAIIFSPAGFSNEQQGSFYYCPRSSSENALAVILYSTGRVRISNKTAKGKRIPCNS